MVKSSYERFAREKKCLLLKIKENIIEYPLIIEILNYSKFNEEGRKISR